MDCFDALTSDRPYRPRLTDAEALEILNQRRGTMYDPLVVDTFVRIHEAIAPESAASGPLPQVLDEIASARKSVPLTVTPPVPDEIAASADETLTMYELARDLSRQSTPNEAAETVASSLRGLIPHSLCVFFVLDESAAELEAKLTIGNGASIIRGLRVSLGQKLSGWVAINRQTILNSDPVLDFGDAARCRALGLKSCLSTPLISSEDLVGVLSLYSTEVSAFTEDHRRILEAVARQASRSIRGSMPIDQRMNGSVNMLPRFEQLAEIVRGSSTSNSERALLLVTLSSLRRGSAGKFHRKGEFIIELIQIVRRTLRESDLLFYNGSDKLAILLKPASEQITSIAAISIRRAVMDAPLFHLTAGSTASELGVDIIPLPVDESIARLLGELGAKEIASGEDAIEGPRIH